MERARRTGPTLLAAGVAALAVAGCARDGRDDDQGQVRLALTNVPADVTCVQLTASGSRTVVRTVAVGPGQSSTYVLGGLPVGAVAFTAAAGGGDCGALTQQNATWVSDPVVAHLQAGVLVDVSLVMRRNGRASVSLDFQDDPDGGADGGAPADGGAEAAPPGCTVTDPADQPDDLFIDSNCDGIDGTAANAIFVALTGSDANPGTMALPKLTIGAAIAAAAATTPKKQVYVSKGVYAGPVTLSSGVSVFGAYDATAGWSRSAANVVEIAGGNPAVVGQDLTEPVELQRLSITGEDAVGPGASAYGARIANSSAMVTFRHCVIRSGDAQDGAHGTNGSNGGQGVSGGPGQNGSQGSSSGGNGGPGGASTCGAAGGNGGLGGFNTGAGASGAPGGPSGTGGLGGPGGAGSTGCFSKASPGGNAGPGANGAPGAHGDAAGPGGISGLLYVPGAGKAGTAGQHGRGGGGGGGGGGGASSGGICNPDR